MKESALSLLHYSSVAVKDYEVSRYMAEKGFASYQVPFIKYNLELDDELEVWRRLSDHMMRVEYMLRILKVLASAIPFSENHIYGWSVKEAVNRLIEKLDMGYEDRLYKIINMFKQLKGDTRDNIYIVTRYVAETLFE